VLFPAAEAVGPRGSVTGIDLANEMVSLTRQRIEASSLKNIEVRQMDAEHLEFPNESFDCVLCAFALFFFPRLDVALAEMVRVLKTRGRLAVTTWRPFDERWKWLNELMGVYLSEDKNGAEQESDKQTDGKPVFNTAEGLKAILSSAGFVEVDVVAESKEFFYSDEEEWWSSAWSHGFREALEAIEKKKGQEGLKEFQAEAFRGLQNMKQPGGIPQLYSVLFGLASKP
jgi:ubiquinone/menaquinone biosynthesis C-methylase UbiE